MAYLVCFVKTYVLYSEIFVPKLTADIFKDSDRGSHGCPFNQAQTILMLTNAQQLFRDGKMWSTHYPNRSIQKWTLIRHGSQHDVLIGSLHYSLPPVVLRQAEANKRLARTGFEQLGLPEADGAGLNASQICVRRVPAKRCDDVDFPAGFTLPLLSKGYRSRLCLHGILHISAATVAGMSDRDLSRLSR